ncbi:MULTISPECIES: DUF817 domain-containing protein [Subtercola]|uniref:DUF817 domain-containing protein n=1 Tax=Subtercola vilae TaxID=2056433 RepID=A0A4T2BIJ4_9MICO|nr:MULTISPECIES: DUF817 domain-containing protein [Subtercola]MEA9985033.1 DUF817 domain-containing protein [Subtercola sp. RTI3]TIH31215.1 DUF817 domain-containing protein [Subtercola vilae]
MPNTEPLPPPPAENRVPGVDPRFVPRTRSANFTSVEQYFDDLVHRLLDRLPATGIAGAFAEFVAFVLKQAWACVFGFLLLAVIFAAKLWYPEGAALARNDVLTLSAVAIQIGMIVARLETLRELRVVILFHIVGTLMELFKTDIGSWSYDAAGILRVGAVPLFSGFMYAAVGSYMVRVYRLFDLRFTRYPRPWLTVVLAALVYANFFTQHYIVDVRWVLLGAAVLLYGPCVMRFRVFRRTLGMPIVVAFALVATFIWFAENIATFSQAWLYPEQLSGWQPVSATKLVSWFLLMIISVVLVTWVYPPRRPAERHLAATGLAA